MKDKSREEIVSMVRAEISRLKAEGSDVRKASDLECANPDGRIERYTVLSQWRMSPMHDPEAVEQDKRQFGVCFDFPGMQVALPLCDKSGTPRILIGVTEDSRPTLHMLDEGGRARLVIGEVGIQLYDESGEPVLSIGPQFFAVGRDGGAQMSVNLDDEGGCGLKIGDGKNIRVTAGFNEDMSTVAVCDERGKPRSVLYFDKAFGPQIHRLNTRGKPEKESKSRSARTKKRGGRQASALKE